MRDTLGPGFSSPGPAPAWAHPSLTLITPIGISFLDLSAHLAISINVHPIINKAQLGFANQLVFQTICLQTVQLAYNIPKEKVKGKHVTQTTQHGSLLPARKFWYSPPFFLHLSSSFLMVASSILEQRFTALCLLYYLTQILSCLPVSESSYTLLPE